jgi:T-complex protein 1 subunit beta
MAKVVGEGAAMTPGKRSLAMEAFATALRAIPTTICDNAGARLAVSPFGVKG